MHDTDLYAKLLGLEKPWGVTNVELKLSELEVHVFVEHGEHAWECPVCGTECGLYDHQPERVWRHLDTMQYTTLLHASPPRVNCPEHGVKTARLPWAERGSRFTLLFERFAIDVMQIASVEAAAKLLRLSWDEAWHIQTRAVERGLKRKTSQPPTYVGIDEKSFSIGHSYMTVICNLETGKVDWVGEDRTAEAVTEYFDQFTDEQLSRIEGFAMDMWRAYSKAVRDRIPDAEAKIIYDRFHVMQEVNKALDTVRKMEHRALANRGSDALKGTKYLWLSSHENISPKRLPEFDILRQQKLKTSRAWALKETLRDLWDLPTLSEAVQFWKRWFFWASHSQLKPVIKAAKKLKRHEHRILNYFAHRITNSMAESINGQIERLKRIANGYRNKRNFRTAILFRHGGLDLYPSTH
ncbi:MAG: ISL3 family transposase [Thermoanaerobaculia bacterium]|nr:ISL3 family transposase [Thermoanaerobaculia bacterium]